MSYVHVGLGADPTEISGLDYVGRQTYLNWVNAVHQRGGVTVRLPQNTYTNTHAPLPSGLEGVLGERYLTTTARSLQLGAPVGYNLQGDYAYYAAPAKVRALDSLHQVQDAAIIAAGNAAGALEDLAKSVTSSIFGPLVAIGVGAAALYFFSHRPRATS